MSLVDEFCRCRLKRMFSDVMDRVEQNFWGRCCVMMVKSSSSQLLLIISDKNLEMLYGQIHFFLLMAFRPNRDSSKPTHPRKKIKIKITVRKRKWFCCEFFEKVRLHQRSRSILTIMAPKWWLSGQQSWFMIKRSWVQPCYLFFKRILYSKKCYVSAQSEKNGVNKLALAVLSEKGLAKHSLGTYKS